MNQITKYLAVKISELCEKGDKLRKVGSIDMPSECGYSCAPKREFMKLDKTPVMDSSRYGKDNFNKMYMCEWE